MGASPPWGTPRGCPAGMPVGFAAHGAWPCPSPGAAASLQVTKVGLGRINPRVGPAGTRRAPAGCRGAYGERRKGFFCGGVAGKHQNVAIYAESGTRPRKAEISFLFKKLFKQDRGF